MIQCSADAGISAAIDLRSLAGLQQKLCLMYDIIEDGPPNEWQDPTHGGHFAKPVERPQHTHISPRHCDAELASTCS